MASIEEFDKAWKKDIAENKKIFEAKDKFMRLCREGTREELRKFVEEEE